MLCGHMAGTANDLLKATARSFYLTLRVLPGQIRAQIGLAYLLARTADTVADTGIVPVRLRLEALGRLRERIVGSTAELLNFGNLALEQGSAAEKLLLERVEDSLTAMQRLSAGDRQLVEKVLVTITSGQELDLRRFAGAEPGEAGPDLPRRAGEPAARACVQAGLAGNGGVGNEAARPRRKVIALSTQAELEDYTYR
ncbi:MAG TPA: squalene/phytoene synthase family protein, partial [Candidatus Acidoferrales bacterium]|nr:squalene/phytoene synthase family protein [Candidatus Acidoferrales bacterium]